MRRKLGGRWAGWWAGRAPQPHRPINGPIAPRALPCLLFPRRRAFSHCHIRSNFTHTRISRGKAKKYGYHVCCCKKKKDIAKILPRNRNKQAPPSQSYPSLFLSTCCRRQAIWLSRPPRLSLAIWPSAVAITSASAASAAPRGGLAATHCPSQPSGEEGCVGAGLSGHRDKPGGRGRGRRGWGGAGRAGAATASRRRGHREECPLS